MVETVSRCDRHQLTPVTPGWLDEIPTTNADLCTRWKIELDHSEATAPNLRAGENVVRVQELDVERSAMVIERFATSGCTHVSGNSWRDVRVRTGAPRRLDVPVGYGEGRRTDRLPLWQAAGVLAFRNGLRLCRNTDISTPRGGQAVFRSVARHRTWATI